jgi:hypothetical protein
MDRPNIEPRPSHFQWHALTVLFLIVTSLMLHPVAVIGGLALHWYGRRREYARGFIQGAAIPSLGFYIWYAVYGPGGFIHQPDQSLLQAIPLSPLVAGLLVPFGKLRLFLRPRSLDEMLIEDIQRLERAAERKRQRARQRALYLPEPKPCDLRLGNILEWDDYPTGSGINKRGDFITIDDWLLTEHVLIIGATGSGKTVLLTRLVLEIALNCQRDIFLVDGKGQDDLAQQVRAICYHFGRGNTPIVRLGQSTGGAAYNGFEGQADAVCNRLVQMVRAPEAEGNAVWFADTNRDILQLACLAKHAGPPKSLSEVRQRLDRAWLTKAWEEYPHELEVIKRISKDDFESLSRRLRVLERPLSQVIHQDGVCLGEVKSLIFSIKTPSISDVSTSFVRFLLEDIKNLLADDLRLPTGWTGVLIVDEFGTFSNDNVIQLLQLARSAGLGVILATQDVSTLGNEITQRRIMSNCNTHILLRSMYPEKVAELAGTTYAIESSVQYDEGSATGLGSSRVQHQFRVKPDVARSLSVGEGFIIRKNKAARLLVTQVPEGELQEMVDKLPPEYQPALTPAKPLSNRPIKKVVL